MRPLLLEDEPLIAIMLVEWLEDLGVSRSRVAKTNAEALELIDQWVPDFAVLDLSVEDGLCYPVARALRARSVPFIFATGYGQDAIDAEFADVPVAKKPFDFDSLEALLGAMTPLNVGR